MNNDPFWLGGVENGVFMNDELQRQHPQIAALGRRFNEFQNSQWRGEFDQKTTLTFGEVWLILREAARLMKIRTIIE